MPRGFLGDVLREALGSLLGEGAWPREGPVTPSFSSRSGARGARSAAWTAFQAADYAGAQQQATPDNPAPPTAAPAPPKAAAKGIDAAAEPQAEQPPSGWENTESVPKVAVLTPSDAYFSKDLADKPPESTFNPVLGCKCEEWLPAPTHPEIDFRKEFLAAHPDFMRRVKTLKVHMEDISMNPPVVHWDAEYDLLKYRDPNDLTAPIRLSESLPAIPKSGTQPRFLQVCPVSLEASKTGTGPHQYELRVSATDERAQPFEYFQAKTMTIQATPAPPPAPPPTEQQAAAAQLEQVETQVAQAMGNQVVAQAQLS